MANETKIDKPTWKKILEFVVKVIEVVIGSWLGATGAINL